MPGFALLQDIEQIELKDGARFFGSRIEIFREAQPLSPLAENDPAKWVVAEADNKWEEFKSDLSDLLKKYPDFVASEITRQEEIL